jgi:Na+/H+ antiporter NhaA
MISRRASTTYIAHGAVICIVPCVMSRNSMRRSVFIFVNSRTAWISIVEHLLHYLISSVIIHHHLPLSVLTS